MTSTTVRDQDALLATARDLATVFAARAETFDQENRFPFENFADLKDAGLLALTVPEIHGGREADTLELVKVVEAIAKGDGPTALAATMHWALITRERVSHQWPEEMFAAVCRQVVAEGSLINSAASEPEMGSPSRGGLPKTLATRTEDGWELSGHKKWTSLSTAATWFVVLAGAQTGDAEPIRSQFLVPNGVAGIEILPTWDNLGMRSTASNDVIFDHVRLDADALLYHEGGGGKPAGSGWTTLPTSAVYLGIAGAARDAAVEYARNRQPSGMSTSIAELQTIQHRVAEMELLLWQSRAVLYQTAEKWVNQPQNHKALEWEVAAAKYTVVNNAIRITDIALRVSGSAGLLHGMPLERLLRDARSGLGNPPMDDVTLTMVGKTALGLA